MSSYKDLKVYKLSYELAKEMYCETRNFPKDEMFGIISQIKRAATSIPLNIAEGYGKGSGGRELMRFLAMARGSCSEMEVLIDFCKDFGYLSTGRYERYTRGYTEVGKMLTGLIRTVEEKVTTTSN